MWNLRSEDRLREWKNFRQQINSLSFDEALVKTATLWSSAPFVLHYLDRMETKDWPSPWELLNENKYDDMAKALGMLYTLFLSDHGKNHTFSIMTAASSSSFEVYNLVLIDQGKYVLNFVPNKVINIQPLIESVSPNKIYSESDLQLSKY